MTTQPEHDLVTKAREIRSTKGWTLSMSAQLDQFYIGAVGALLNLPPDQVKSELQSLTAALEIGRAIIDEPEATLPPHTVKDIPPDYIFDVNAAIHAAKPSPLSPLSVSQQHPA